MNKTALIIIGMVGTLAWMMFVGTLGYSMGQRSRNQEVSVYREHVINEMLDSVCYREVAIRVTMKLRHLERSVAEILVDDENTKYVPIIRQQLKAEGKL